MTDRQIISGPKEGSGSNDPRSLDRNPQIKTELIPYGVRVTRRVEPWPPYEAFCYVNASREGADHIRVSVVHLGAQTQTLLDLDSARAFMEVLRREIEEPLKHEGGVGR